MPRLVNSLRTFWNTSGILLSSDDNWLSRSKRVDNETPNKFPATNITVFSNYNIESYFLVKEFTSIDANLSSDAYSVSAFSMADYIYRIPR